jgi:transposase InsO family protein
MIASQFQERSVIYKFIRLHQQIYPLEKMCKVMGVGSRSYYAWKNGSKPAGGSKVAVLEDKIKAIYFKKKQRYGSPRIAAELLDDGVAVSRVTVAKYMKKIGLRSKIGKKFKVTTDSKHSHKIMDNVLDRNFTPSKPSKVWVSDITYIHTKEGFIYLTTVLDLYDRKCIGWSISETMRTEETSLAAWKMAIKNRKLSPGLIFHSDRGVQYACEKFSNTVDSYKIVTRSMSRNSPGESRIRNKLTHMSNGDCLDNAVAESFFKLLSMRT